MSLVNDSLKFTSSDTQICWNFLLKKNVSSFCSAKAAHIFLAKNIRILYIESAKSVNEMTLNELVKLTMLWSTGPWCQSVLQFLSIFCSTLTYRCLKSPKRDIGKQCTSRSDAVKRGVRSGSTIFELSIGISIKHNNNKISKTPLLLEMDRSKDLR